MPGRTRLLALAVLLAAAAAAPAAPAAPPESVLDLVPEDAAAALVVRNIADVKKKGDKFFDDVGIKETRFVPRPSALFDELYKFLEIKAGVDEDAPVALIMANVKKAGFNGANEAGDNLFVVAVPFKDRAKIAANFNIKGDDLKEGKVVTGEARRFGALFCARGKHLLIANNDKALDSVLKGKSVGAALSEAQRKSLADADVLLHFNPDSWGDDWSKVLEGAQKQLGEGRGEADRKVIGDLANALKTIRFGLGAIRVGDGIGLSLVAVFPDKVPEPTRKFLASLAGGAGGSDLKGLPDGPAIFAQASKGDGAQNARVMKLLADLLLRDAFQAEWLPSATDRANVLAAFAEVWKKLKGHRVAVYRNADERKHGLFSAVAIFDTADADKFLADLKLLARLSGTEGLDLSAKGRKDDVAEVEKLIRDLGSDEFEVRESASNRLALIGEPALPQIEKALKSDDAEVRRRAEELKEKIVEAAVARRKDLLSKEAPWRVRPTFHFEPKPETRGGHAVETARVRLKEKDAPAAEELRQLLGPDWDKVRLAAHGKQLVVLLGSDDRLLDAALANLKDGKPGLAASKVLAGFGKQADPARALEFHASAETVMALMRADDLRLGKPAGRVPSLSSASLGVGPDRLRLDLWVPVSEVKAIWKGQEP
jgi:hypothetical protein